jgi:hypothetical protein
MNKNVFSDIAFLSLQVTHISEPAGFETACSDNGDTDIYIPPTTSGQQTAELLNQVRLTTSWRLVAGFPPRRPGFELGSGHEGFVVDKAALGRVSSEYFRFHCQSFHRLLHTHHHSSSGAGTIEQIVVT